MTEELDKQKAGAEVGTREGSPAWRAVKAVLPWAITVAIFYFIFREVPAGDVIDALLEVNAWLWVPVVIFNFATYLLFDTASHYLAFNWLAAKVGYVEVLFPKGAAFILNMINFLIGQGGMAYWLAKKKGVPAGEAASTVFLLVFLDLFNVFFLSALGIALMPDVGLEDFFSGGEHGHLVRIVYVGLVIFIAILGFWIVKPKVKFLGFMFEGPMIVFQKLRMKHVLSILGVKWLTFVSDLFCTWLGLVAFDMEVSVSMVLAYLPIIYFIGALPITVFRMGTVPAWVFFFRDVAPQESLIAFSLLWNFCMQSFRAITGLVCLPATMKDFKKVQEEVGQD
jgi:hypothetical protein